MKSAIAILLVLSISASVAGSVGPSQGGVAKSHLQRAAAMAGAAEAWLAALPEDVLARAQVPFDAEGRLAWRYTGGGERPGVTLAEQGPEARRLLDRLLQAFLSQHGYLKAHGVIALEQSLDRDPYLYHALVYGDPSSGGPWGWRLEGHHLSLHVTVSADGAVSWTPLFLGAEPAVLPDGPQAGFELFYEELDLARRLLASLAKAERALASPEREPPGDVVLDPSRTTGFEAAEGLPARRMSPQQSHLLMRLLGLHAGLVHEDLALPAMNRYRTVYDELRFLYLGAAEPGARCYYRIHAPELGLAVELSDRGGHVHCSWRELPRDFGGALAADAGEKED